MSLIMWWYLCSIAATINPYDANELHKSEQTNLAAPKPCENMINGYDFSFSDNGASLTVGIKYGPKNNIYNIN